MEIRPARPDDQPSIWAILEPVLRGGETYALPPELSRQDALAYWHAPTHQVFVATEGEKVLGTYYLRPNQMGPGAHVANCGYMTAEAARGRGVASAMCVHSLAEARRRGYLAMQYNLVVTTNEGAIRLWEKHGFATVGRLPGAFRHPTLGLVDALVMYRKLEDDGCD
ncbi:MAG: N-acetyltransferase family protein [Vulcanimicrobiota bacterium]